MQKIQSLLNWFVGKRTYIVAIVFAVLNLAVEADWITVENLEAINAVLAALGLSALRAGVAGK